MKATLSTFIALLACCWGGSAMANGSNLLQQCQQTLIIFDGGKSASTSDAAQCLGRLDGTVDGLEIARSTYSTLGKKQLPDLFCWPDQLVTKDQTVRIVVKYLKEHPESLHMGESALVILALIDAFPCQTK